MLGFELEFGGFLFPPGTTHCTHAFLFWTKLHSFDCPWLPWPLSNVVTPSKRQKALTSPSHQSWSSRTPCSELHPCYRLANQSTQNVSPSNKLKPNRLLLVWRVASKIYVEQTGKPKSNVSIISMTQWSFNSNPICQQEKAHSWLSNTYGSEDTVHRQTYVLHYAIKAGRTLTKQPWNTWDTYYIHHTTYILPEPKHAEYTNRVVWRWQLHGAPLSNKSQGSKKQFDDPSLSTSSQNSIASSAASAFPTRLLGSMRLR